MIKGLKCDDCTYSTLNTHGKIVCLLPTCILDKDGRVNKECV